MKRLSLCLTSLCALCFAIGCAPQPAVKMAQGVDAQMPCKGCGKSMAAGDMMMHCDGCNGCKKASAVSVKCACGKEMCAGPCMMKSGGTMMTCKGCGKEMMRADVMMACSDMSTAKCGTCNKQLTPADMQAKCTCGATVSGDQMMMCKKCNKPITCTHMCSACCCKNCDKNKAKSKA